MPGTHIGQAAGCTARLQQLCPWLQQDQCPTPPSRSRNKRFSTRLAAGSLFLVAVQRFAAQHVNGVLQIAGSNNKFVRDGSTYWVNW
jgi:hypothetical protein